MSVADLLDRFFESEQVKAVMAIDGLIGTWAGPYEPGTAYVMAHHEIGDVGDGTLGSWGVPEGGMGAVAAALERSARAFGAEVRTDAAVEKVLISGGRARGVVLRDGEELAAPIVITACHPKITFLRQIDRHELPEGFVDDMEHWSSRSGVVKINCAISKLPTLAGEPDWRDFSGGFEIAPSIDQLERSFEEARAGRPATLPFSDGMIPTRWIPRSRRRARTWSPSSRSGSRTRGPKNRIERSSRPTPTASCRRTRTSRRGSGSRSSPGRCSGRTTWRRSGT